MSDSLWPHGLAHEASLSMEFSWQEYLSGLPFPSPGDLPSPGTKPALQADSLPSAPPGKPQRREDSEKIYLPSASLVLLVHWSMCTDRMLSLLCIWVTSPTPQPLFKKPYFILHGRVFYPSFKKENWWGKGSSWAFGRERNERSSNSENANKIYV